MRMPAGGPGGHGGPGGPGGPNGFEKRRPERGKNMPAPAGARIPLDDLPPHILQRLTEYKISPEDVKLTISHDYNMDFTFGETWLVATADALFAITEKPEEVRKFSFEEFDNFEVNNLPTSGAFLIREKKNDTKRIVSRYSNSKARQTAHFIILLHSLIENGKISEEDLEEAGIENRRCKKCGKPLAPHELSVCRNCQSKRKVLSRLFSYSNRYKGRLAIVLLLIMASAIFQVVTPYLTGEIYMDRVLQNPEATAMTVFSLFLAVLGVQILAVFLDSVSGRFNAKFAADVIYQIKTECFGKMSGLSMRFFTDRETGNLMTRINQDANDVQWFFIDGLPYFFMNAAQIAGVVAVMIYMSPVISLTVAIPVPFIIMFLKFFMPRFHKMFRRSHRKQSDMNSQMNESFTGVKVVKAFGTEETEVDRFKEKSKSFADEESRIHITGSALFPSMQLLMWSGSLLVYFFGGIQIIQGNILFGQLTSMIAYVGMLYSPIEWFSRLINHLSRSMEAANRIFEVIDSTPEIAESEHPITPDSIQGKIEFKNVCFSYDPNVEVLSNINFTAMPNEHIGIVGHSGAGKTTLINLILRLYDVDSGSVMIDGVNIKELSFDFLHKNIGIVLQDTYLFMGTIADNIAYAKPGATREEIINAAKEASAHDFIMATPDGYDTYIGSGAHSLSGGERQRISLARTILKNPKILILDEATSAVDTATELSIQKTMEKLSKGRTTLNIAHRLSTLRNADKMIVIDDGKIVQEGTHDTLAEDEGGVYKRLYDIQKEALKVRGIED